MPLCNDIDDSQEKEGQVDSKKAKFHQPYENLGACDVRKMYGNSSWVSWIGTCYNTQKPIVILTLHQV